MFSTVTSKLQKLCNLIVAEIDGMEILSILAVLQQYVTDHILSKQLMLQTQQQEQEQLLQPQHAGILTTTTAAPAPTSTSTTAIQPQNTKTEIAKPDHSSLYLITMLHELRFSLLSKLKSYVGDQVAWILAQKSDPKKAGVTVPVAKFPSFVRQVLEMTGGQVYYSVYHTISYCCLHSYRYFLFLSHLLLLFSPSYFSDIFHC